MKNDTNGTYEADLYLQDRQHYVRLAKTLGSALNRVMAKEDLVDLRAELLVISIQAKDQNYPLHAHALLIQLVAEIQDNIKRNHP